MTQLEKDLQRAIDDKLHKWMKDSFDLFLIAEMPKEGAICVLHSLLHALAGGFAQFNMPDEHSHEIFQSYLDRAKRSRDRVRAQRMRQP